ncbi:MULTISPECIES: hypothetical protein [Pasteurellaceae]|uniref:hypothetical protein n=1 Tax=Pasteurellaceae TaxID=712 RepID=UPI0005538A63|nr:hypothetical protein [Avibacterium paragallinarum]AZI13984.1 hypothetical protein EIA51_04725 [Avibacterium paragallinarum]QIR11448.1 hypothetical protein HBL79_03870 [Avibacterium paragallinarum]QJE09578.1 hypothetical protein HHJ62_04280 [Avibacterium paragallinarum]QJE11773.1 hypothetical protein HHJ61_04280 [Avibacterium paragallinarum]QJE13974.1 hypothetical protein HHJ60_04295 [Avibacterium paragallinarum]
MTMPFKRIFLLLFVFLQFGCSGFLNPFHDCFLDWNMNCIEKEKKRSLESGYIYSYPGSGEDAKIISNRCRLKNNNNSLTQEECLLKNGFKKISN